MEKPRALSAWLVANVKGLADDPTKLSVFIDKGAIVAHATRTLSFEYRYTVNLVLQDFAGEMDAIFVPLLAWIEQHEPLLLKREPHQPFDFEAELLDGDAADVSITLQLTERVLVNRTIDGGYEAAHQAEPSFPDAFEGAGGATFAQLFLGAERVVPGCDPAP